MEQGPTPPEGPVVGLGPSRFGAAGRAYRRALARVLRPYSVVQHTVNLDTARRLERLEQRVGVPVDGAAPPPGGAWAGHPDGNGAPAVWSPPDLEAAMEEIFTTADPAVFESSGRQQAETLQDLFGPQDVVLDVGCGVGRVARYVAPSCRRLLAADSSPQMLALARERIGGEAPNISFVTVDGTRLPVGDDAVDLVYSVLVLQHLEREHAFAMLREIRRVLKRGGRAYLTFPNILSDEYLDTFLGYVRDGEAADPRRARLYTPQEVERLLPAAGFAIDQLDAGVEIVAVCS
ncbi:MAG: class I SAM-dependent methyltransferase [Thermoleophilia bacterium]